MPFLLAQSTKPTAYPIPEFIVYESLISKASLSNLTGPKPKEKYSAFVQVFEKQAAKDRFNWSEQDKRCIYIIYKEFKIKALIRCLLYILSIYVCNIKRHWDIYKGFFALSPMICYSTKRYTSRWQYKNKLYL